MATAVQLQESFVRRVRSAAAGHTLSHAIILTGTGDLGEAARFVAAAHLCREGGAPCLKCNSCRKVMEGIHPDVITVDPPRKGISADVIEAVAEMAPERLVYVSCDPGTLARDVKLLSERGYVFRSAEAVDLFPRTKHVETVVLMSRVKG